MAKPDLTAARLREMLNYDPETGVFTSAKLSTYRSGGRSIGDVAGGPAPSHGYWRISVDGRQHYAHRLVWLYVHGKWPDGEVDHIDGDRTNNRLANLRDVSPTFNRWNRRVACKNNPYGKGVMGVTLCKKSGSWVAQIKEPITGYRRLGCFKTMEEAQAAYQVAKRAVQEKFGL